MYVELIRCLCSCGVINKCLSMSVGCRGVGGRSPGNVAFTQKPEVLQTQPRGKEKNEDLPFTFCTNQRKNKGAYSKMLKKSEISWWMARCQ